VVRTIALRNSQREINVQASAEAKSASIATSPPTGTVNGRLWGARADEWSQLQESKVAPAYEAAFARAQLTSTTQLLDVGCGAGLAALIATRRGARVTGIDASEALLAIARTRVPGGEFHAGDIEQLPFADARFDLVTGFNAFQYAGNPARALAEARRVSRPGGHVVVTTWGRPEGMEAAQLIAALRPMLPPAPPGAPGPFALSDETTLRTFAVESGLQVIEVFDTDAPWEYADLPTALRALKSSGVAVRAIEFSGEPAVDDAHTQALGPFRRADGSYRVNATFRSLLARV
jgi:ubiquinone/menaquinone biosynthesis C-methylase UbiE